MIRPLFLAALFALGFGGLAEAGGRQSDDPDWPCPQRRTGPISAGALWSGPDIAQAAGWDKDFQAAALARKLASRRTSPEEADAALDAFAAEAGADKPVRLTRVFVGMLEFVNNDRDKLISGVVRYARGQNRLAEQIRIEADKISDAQESADVSSPQAVEDSQSGMKWQKRIFDERSHALTYVCETPVLLERRAFDLARRIQQRL